MIRAFESGADEFADVVLRTRTFELLIRTAGLAMAVTVAAIVIAVPLAWFTTRSDLPWRRFWSVATALPLVIPSYVGGFAFVAALGPRGMLQAALSPLGVERLPEIYGFPGAWLVLTLFTYPYVLLTTRAAILGLDSSLEEAALTLGKTRWEIFFRVLVPQLRPAVAAGGLLVALYTLHDFGAVSLLRFDSFTRAIYVSYRGSFDRSAAAILSLILITLSLLIVAAESRSRRRADYHRIHSGGGRRTLVIPLGAWRWAVFAGCTLLLAISLGIPVAVIGYWLIRGTTGANAIGATLAAAFNTVRAAAAGTFLCLLAAWPVAALSVRHPGRTSRFIETSSFVGYALPGLVVALSLVFLTARWVPFLYQGLALLALAYAVLFLPQAVGAMRASLLQVSPQLEEAARTLGAGRAGTFFKVVLPLVRPGVLAGSALVFLTAMKELPATLLLSPPGFATLATRVWGATTDAFFARAAAPALALIALSSVPLTFLVLKERTQEKSGVAPSGG